MTDFLHREIGISSGRGTASPSTANPDLNGVALRYDTSMYIQRGYDYLDEGDYPAAIAAFDSAIKLGLGDLAAAHVGMGMAYTRHGASMNPPSSASTARLQEQPYMAQAYLARGAAAAGAASQRGGHRRPDAGAAYRAGLCAGLAGTGGLP